MDFTTLIGILSGAFMLFWAIYGSAGFNLFLNLNAFLITVGGTFAATLINFPVSDILRSLSIVRQVFFTRNNGDVHDSLSMIMSLANTYKEDGPIALENSLDEINDSFTKRGVELIIDGEKPENIDYHFETEVLFLQERHKRGQRMFLAMAKYAPAFGMIGTLIGLIDMLKSLKDPTQIGEPMAVALVTTFYGSLLANLLFLPIAGKLKERSAQEMNQKLLISEGIMRIAKGESQRSVKEELISYLPSKNRDAVLEVLDEKGREKKAESKE